VKSPKFGSNQVGEPVSGECLAASKGGADAPAFTIGVPGMFNNLEVKVHSQSDDDEV
jgi:hypothetical protein